MKYTKLSVFALASSMMFSSCSDAPKEKEEVKNEEVTSTTVIEVEDDFKWKIERFADIKVIRYQMPSFDKLSLQQQKLVYFLTQAGYAGRDIIWDQNYRHNLKIRKALENIYTTYSGDKSTEDWNNFTIYLKRSLVCQWYTSPLLYG